MAAPRASAESGNATLYVMIVFIVLFLVAAVFAVMMYMDNEKYLKDAQQAQERLRLIGNDQEINALQSLADSQRSVLRRLDADIKTVATLVGGPEMESVALGNASRMIGDMQAAAFNKAQSIQQMNDQDLNTAAIFTDATPENGLINLIDALITQVQTAKTVKDQIKTQLTQEIDRQKQQIDGLNAKVAELNQNINKLSQAASDYRNAMETEVARLSGDFATLTQRKDGEYQNLEKENQTLMQDYKRLEEAYNDFSTRMKELEEVLGSQRPRPDMEMEALQPDGLIVSVVPEDELTYINLSRNDRIYRGLTFSVYDSFQEFPRTGKGKGMIEVIEVMDTISKCRITEYDATNPILKGDIIANLFWDKNKDYKFCVTGDFDFNRDGTIDADGRDRIIALIAANEVWKGKIVNDVTVDTDFMVIGLEPAEPAVPVANEFGEVSETARQAYEKALMTRDRYNINLQNAKALGVPTFNTDRFYYFIGYTPGQER